MKYSSHIASISELAESEGIFTAAQAARMGVPRDALSHAVKAGRIERIRRGAYRFVGSRTSPLDELTAVYKLTAPSLFAHERMAAHAWDGIAVGGATAASILGIGDFYLSPYRIYAPRRINPRNADARFGIRRIERADVSFADGLPVTNAERTMLDLVLDAEDPSLIADALRDAVLGNVGFDLSGLRGRLRTELGAERADAMLDHLVADAGIKAEATA